MYRATNSLFGVTLEQALDAWTAQLVRALDLADDARLLMDSLPLAAIRRD